MSLHDLVEVLFDQAIKLRALCVLSHRKCVSLSHLQSRSVM